MSRDTTLPHDERPELHGRRVPPAIAEHEARLAQVLRDRIRALAPADDFTTTSPGEAW